MNKKPYKCTKESYYEMNYHIQGFRGEVKNLNDFLLSDLLNITSFFTSSTSEFLKMPKYKCSQCKKVIKKKEDIALLEGKSYCQKCYQLHKRKSRMSNKAFYHKYVLS